MTKRTTTTFSFSRRLGYTHYDVDVTCDPNVKATYEDRLLKLICSGLPVQACAFIIDFTASASVYLRITRTAKIGAQSSILFNTSSKTCNSGASPGKRNTRLSGSSACRKSPSTTQIDFTLLLGSKLWYSLTFTAVPSPLYLDCVKCYLCI